VGYSGDGGAATSASLSYESGVAFNSLTGDLYIADLANNVVRMVTKSTGIISTVAGTGVAGYTGDNGLATRGQLRNPAAVACDPVTGNIYIADNKNSVIRMITKSTGIITTVAGDGNFGYSGDGGLAISASLALPSGCAYDPITGNLYIVDSFADVVRMVTTSTGIITTVAGNGNGTFTGGTRPATSAILSNPFGVAVETATGNIYIADNGNNIIRLVTKSTGIITTIAGKVSRSSGTNAGYSGDGGKAVLAMLNMPNCVAVDAISGDVYISDTGNNVIRMIKKSTGIITTVAGNGMVGYSGDGGRATAAMLSYPLGVAFDATSGTMYIADPLNNVIRNVIGTPSQSSGPTASPIANPSTAATFAPTASSSAGEEISQIETMFFCV
jgi:trimeric autotransporter adhesin